ncbi:hypothetical protein SPLC1_S061520 [Arthrospira platensis C1]|nr:hypothetical protein SPLC1_S061520 [Arthrospira platensis C1]
MLARLPLTWVLGIWTVGIKTVTHNLRMLKKIKDGGDY